MITGVRWYLIVILICLSLMIHDVEHLFTWLLAISKSSLEKCLFTSSVGFLIRFFFFFLVPVVWILCVLWILTFYQIYLFPFSRQTLCFVDSSLHCAKVFQFAVIHLFIFVFVSFAWGDISKRPFLRQTSVKEDTALFSSRSCMVSDLTFKSFNNIK